MVLAHQVDDFMSWVSNWASAEHPPVFSYLAIEHEGALILIKGMLYLNMVKPNFAVPTCLKVDKIRVGYMLLDGEPSGLLDFCAQVLTGAFVIGTEHVSMVSATDMRLSAVVVNAVDDTLISNATRPAVSRLVGASHNQNLGSPFAWSLRSGELPFDSLDDLVGAYSLGKISELSTVEVVALQAVQMDGQSTINGDKATFVVKVWAGFDHTRVRIGYRIFPAGGVPTRGSFPATSIEWTPDAEGHLGRVTISVERGSVAHSYAIYDSRAQHQWWFWDPVRSQNPRRSIFQAYDDDLEKLKTWLSAAGKNKGRDFEVGMTTLGWLLGFNSLHLDGNSGISDAPDVVLSCDRGVILVECTTGAFGTDKVGKLLDRRRIVRRQLTESGQSHLAVECLVASSVLEQDAAIERKTTAEHGVGFVGRETINALLTRTLRIPDPNQLFEELVRIATA